MSYTKERGPVLRPAPLELRNRVLEVNANAELHGARAVTRTGDLAEGGRAVHAKASAARLVVVHDVGEGEEELGAYSFFVEPQILHNLSIQVPGGQAAQVCDAAATGVKS